MQPRAMALLSQTTPDPVTEPTAELAFGLMIDLARNISHCNSLIRNPNGLKWGVMQNLATGLNQKQRLGIIGMGAIGQSVARRAVASQMEIVYNNRTQLPLDIELKYNAKYVTLNELLKTADVVSLHCPLTPETHHLIDAEKLKLMKPSAYLINTARGAVVNGKGVSLCTTKNNLLQVLL